MEEKRGDIVSACDRGNPGSLKGNVVCKISFSILDVYQRYKNQKKFFQKSLSGRVIKV